MAARHVHKPILTFTTTIHFWTMDPREDRDCLIAGLSDLFAVLKKRCGMSRWGTDAIIDRFLREKTGGPSIVRQVRHLVNRRPPDLIERITLNVWIDELDERRSQLIREFCELLESLRRRNKISQWCADAISDRFFREHDGDYSLIDFDSINEQALEISQPTRTAPSMVRAKVECELNQQLELHEVAVNTFAIEIQESIEQVSEMPEADADELIESFHWCESPLNISPEERRRRTEACMIM
jgi:hypothetical protein